MNDSEVELVKAAFSDAIHTLREADNAYAAITGDHLLAPEPRSILDASRSNLEDLLTQCRLADRALTLALGWVGPNNTLGRVFKTAPTDAVTELSEALRVAGLFPEGGQ